MHSALEMKGMKGCRGVCFFNHCFQKNKKVSAQLQKHFFNISWWGWERKESCKVDGMITTSFQIRVRALITGVWSPAQ